MVLRTDLDDSTPQRVLHKDQHNEANQTILNLQSSLASEIATRTAATLTFKGTWNPATNSPTLANGIGTQGDFYVVSVAGTVNLGSGAITFASGDYVSYLSGVWSRSARGLATQAALTAETNRALAAEAVAAGDTTAWVEPTPTGNWANLGAPYEVARYRKWKGVVFLEGMVQNTLGTANAATVLTLPVGFRPRAYESVTAYNTSFQIGPDGSVGPSAAAPGAAFMGLRTSFIPDA